MCSRVRFLIVVVIAALTVACEKVPLLAPTGATISASAPTDVLPPGGSTEVTAFVLESGGTPVQNGTRVRFSATLGRVEPAEADTRGGQATTRFIAGNTSGTARITATSGAATGSGGADTTSSNVVQIQVGAAAAAGVVVSTVPSRVPASGGTVTVIASAVGESGNSLPGVPVSFSTDAGTLSSNSAVTDANGEARVTLTTNRAATVTARVGTKVGTAAVAVAPAPSIALSVTTNSPTAGAPVAMTVTPAAGTTPRVVIDWGDGTLQDLGTLTAARNVTHVYQNAGQYTITATGTEDGESFSTSTTVSVGAASVTLSAPSPNPATVGQPVSLSVTPTAGTTPRVVIDWGDGRSDDLGTVASQRTVFHTYTSPGTFIITARSTSGSETATTSTAVTVNARPAVGVTISPSSSTPNRCSPVTFTANVTPNGTDVSSYRWVIDSNDNSEDETITTTGNQLTRVFRQTGTKTISVTVDATDGRSATGQTQIVVGTSTTTCSVER